ncbi:hypothetical protein SLEP1_g55172 [Rubroshorea leprosula]|uniref:AAA+ ATPase domain-containing protein n=1 Tax=Rubroshorea leprosula TaxID=152421 RepID=A0AAV5MEW9_9ROSI|nr:hypothetical protein SLEP1_g55172 [Rubroshorea leprosula]
MAGAFCVPVVQNALGTVAGNWIDRSLKRISYPIILVFKMKANVEKLRKQVEKLEEELDHVERCTQDAERRGEEMALKHKNWRDAACKFIEAANTIENGEEKAKKKCFFGMCLNPWSRYKLSKKAVEDSQKIAEHAQKVPGFNLQPFCPPILQRVVAAPVKGFQEFESRMGVLDETMKALQSPNINIIGLHGMPGVGKTMLLKEVKRKAEEEKKFDAVVMVTVAEKNPDCRKIQDHLAYGLGLQLPFGIGDRSIADTRVADQLRARFLKKKVLVILDDIWDKLDLEALGIPFEDQQKMNVETGSSSTEDQQMKCKILLSSRELNVLKTEMCTQKEIVINQLEDQEAWQMFKKIVGDRAESNDFQSTGFEIARKCTGLPLAIVPLAEALKNKSLPEWRNALQRLNNPSPSNFNGIHAKVYTAIEVSYNHLGSKELKQTFLLSSLMDRNASLQDLLKYGVGLGLFSQSNTIGEARNEVITLVGDLKASSLLIDGSDRGRFDVHDVIRDVAVSIACRAHYGLFLTDDDLLKKCSDENGLKDFKWIFLEYTNMNELPKELESPQLTLFQLSNNCPPLEIPANFFKGMQRLRVLDLTCMQMSSLPSSICLLTNLHTLCLDQGVLGDISIIGELKNLEVLSLLRSDIKMLPREIGQLTRLKLLDLSGCSKLKVILPRVLASLSKLEELYLGNSFNRWEHDEHESQRNASLAELKHLKKLTALEIRIRDVEMIPKDLSFEKLERYEIFIGDAWNKWDSSAEISRILKLRLRASVSFDSSLKQLLKMSEELHLEELKGVKNIIYELDSEGFQELKHLYIHNAPDIQHIMKSAALHNAFPILEFEFPYLEKLKLSSMKITTIWHTSATSYCTQNLTELIVEGYDNLEHLFLSSMARGLVKLRHLKINQCKNMREIIVTENVEEMEISFPKLDFLHIENLQNLVGIYSGNCIMAFPSLKQLTILNCPKLKEFMVNSMSTDIATDIKPLFNEQMMEGVIVAEGLAEEERRSKMLFPNLQALVLECLSKLTRFCPENCIEFPNLTRLQIGKCRVLKTFTSSPVIGDIAVSNEKAENTYAPPFFNEKVAFPQIEDLAIYCMESLNKIWADQLDGDSFCKLKAIGIGWCEMLVSIFPFSMLERLQRLDHLRIRGCDSLEEIVEAPSASHSQALVDTQPTLVETDTEFVFSKLTKLELDRLQKLKGFCHRMHIKCPSLKLLEVSVCEQVQIFASEFPNFQRINGDDQLEIQIQCPLFSVSKATFSNLEELKLKCNAISKEVWRGQHSREFLPKLKSIELINYCERSAFHQSFFLSLPSLEKLVVSETSFHCWDELFQSEELGGEDNPALALARLSELRLSKLNELTYLWEEESQHESVFYNLRVLEVQECGKLKNLMPSFIYFWNLHTLELSRCHGLKNLMRYSTAKGLVQLTKMSVNDCAMMEEIVACMDDEVGYYGLENLKISEFELVDQAIIEIWNKNPGEILPFRNLKSLELEGFNLEYLKLSGNINIQQIWHNRLPEMSSLVRNLIRCSVEGCGSLKYLLTSSMVKSLVNLQGLVVKNCKMMEGVIVPEEGFAEEVTTQKIFFPNLLLLVLEDHPKLKRFCSGNYIAFPRINRIIIGQCPLLKAFTSSPVIGDIVVSTEKAENTSTPLLFDAKVAVPVLEKLVIKHMESLDKIWHNQLDAESFCKLKDLHVICCKTLESIFPFRMLERLQRLEKLFISRCDSLEVIFEPQGHIASYSQALVASQPTLVETETKLVLPKLTELTLQSLPKLKGFCHPIHFKCPSLKKLAVVEVRQLEIFALEFPSFQSTTSDHQLDTRQHPLFWINKVRTQNILQ